MRRSVLVTLTRALMMFPAGSQRFARSSSRNHSRTRSAATIFINARTSSWPFQRWWPWKIRSTTLSDMSRSSLGCSSNLIRMLTQTMDTLAANTPPWRTQIIRLPQYETSVLASVKVKATFTPAWVGGIRGRTTRQCSPSRCRFKTRQAKMQDIGQAPVDTMTSMGCSRPPDR